MYLNMYYTWIHWAYKMSTNVPSTPTSRQYPSRFTERGGTKNPEIMMMDSGAIPRFA